MPKEEEEEILSKFNEAMLQMKRLHDEQTIINQANQTPLLMNQDFGSYGYEIIFKSLENQFKEISPNLNKKEFLTGIMRRLRLKESMKKFPPHVSKWNNVTGGESEIFYKENWEIVSEMLFHYSLYIRKMMDNHNLTSPKQGESAWF